MQLQPEDVITCGTATGCASQALIAIDTEVLATIISFGVPVGLEQEYEQNKMILFFAREFQKLLIKQDDDNR